MVKRLVTSATESHHVTEYDGIPCPVRRGPCRNGGRCVPRLNDFDCQCTAGFDGKLCQTCTSLYARLYNFIVTSTDFGCPIVPSRV